MKLVVYTTVFGDTDRLRPMDSKLLQGARAVCFTDHPSLMAPGWEIEHLPRQDRPTRASRCLKAMSHVAFPEADATLWMDASFRLTTRALDLAHRFRHPWISFRHPDRTRIVQESEAVIRLGKARPDAVRRQLEEYQAAGFDLDAAPQRVLSENGFLLRRHTTDVCRMNELWWSETMRHTLRDQLSVDYCAWRLGLAIEHWPWPRRRNPICHYVGNDRPVNDY